MTKGNKVKVTDLEKFAYEDVWRPYWPAHPDAGPRDFASGTPETYEKRFGRGGLKHTLMQTLTLLEENREYRHLVVGRLSAIGVQFPDYVKHPLVDAIKIWIREFEAEDRKEKE